MVATLVHLVRSKAFRYALVAVVAAGALWHNGYVVGKHRTEKKHAAQLAAIEKSWAAKVSTAEEEAYRRGLAARKAETANRRAAMEIARQAGAEPGADDTCLSAEIVDKLRALE